MLQNITKNILTEIYKLQKEKNLLLIAIDGRCASGKTTLAQSLFEQCDCNVIPTDHFFLRPEQRTSERYQEAGGNLDRERFLEEVLVPLSHSKSFAYRPYDCHKQKLVDPIFIEPKTINLIEGSYSCHPALKGFYDLTIFLTVDEIEQMRRIQIRNGKDNAVMFQKKWIPLEEHYFSTYQIQEQCDLYFNTTL